MKYKLIIWGLFFTITSAFSHNAFAWCSLIGSSMSTNYFLCGSGNVTALCMCTSVGSLNTPSCDCSQVDMINNNDLTSIIGDAPVSRQCEENHLTIESSDVEKIFMKNFGQSVDGAVKK